MLVRLIEFVAHLCWNEIRQIPVLDIACSWDLIRLTLGQSF